MRDAAGSQSQRRIWLILPAHGANYMVKFCTVVGQIVLIIRAE